MARQQSLLNFLGTVLDAQLFRDEGLGCGRLAAWAARRLGLPQRLHHGLLESAAWLGIDGRVNCFVADKARTDGLRHLAEFGGNLLR